MKWGQQSAVLYIIMKKKHHRTSYDTAEQTKTSLCQLELQYISAWSFLSSLSFCARLSGEVTVFSSRVDAVILRSDLQQCLIIISSSHNTKRKVQQPGRLLRA